jgi:glycerol-3-phosphate acyltransferase PlsX
MVNIVLDAMGSDYSPAREIEGALLAVRELGVEIILVGPEPLLHQELRRHEAENHPAISTLDAPEVIHMQEPVAQAIRKRNSTIHVGLRHLREGRANGFVSAGNTGAVMATAKMICKTVSTIDRPAVAALLPTLAQKPVLLLDVGANAKCKPSHLLQFAIMGATYAHALLGLENPSVGLISIGEEEGKGNELTREAHRLLEQSNLNFVGNVEGRDIYTGKADVVVCDGFTGNVILKTSEGVSEMFFAVLKDELLNGLKSELGQARVPAVFENIWRRYDYQEFGGAPLLGVKQVCIICHGRSSGRAIRNAIKVASELCLKQVPQRIEQELVNLEQQYPRGN